jgi:ring-1,2-phenylacetyl-CoA epoxidase subunit PaaC
VKSEPPFAAASVLGRLGAAKHGLGHRLAFAGLSSPAVEAAVATVAVAQEELGHARLLYASEARLRGVGGEDDVPDVPTAPPDPGLVPVLDGWPDVLATLATLDTAVLLWLQALAGGRHAWLRTRAERMLAEEAFHRDYVRGWLAVTREHPRLRARVEEALDARRRRYGEWLRALTADAGPLLAAGFLETAPTVTVFDETVRALVTES